MNSYEEALTFYDEAIEIESTRHLAGFSEGILHFHKGTLLERLDRHEEALLSYKTATAIEPSSGMSWFFYGRLLQLIYGYGEDAIAAYDKSLEFDIDKRYQNIHENWWKIAILSNKGDIFDELHRYEDAISCYDDIVLVQSDYAQALALRGRSRLRLTLSELAEDGDLLDKDRLLTALDDSNKAIHLNSENCVAHFTRAMGYVFFHIGDIFSSPLELTLSKLMKLSLHKLKRSSLSKLKKIVWFI